MKWRIYLASLILTIACGLCVNAQTTAFTYQGFVKDGASTANGNYDFQFLLFSAASGGSQIDSTNFRLNVPVTNGIFTVLLDFNAAGFTGPDRYLEIRVRPSGTTTYTTLSPRSLIASAPYSVHAVTATNALLLGNVPAANYLQSGSTSINAGTQYNIGGNRVFHAPGTNNTFIGQGAGISNPNFATTDHTAVGFNAGSSLNSAGSVGSSFFGSRAGQSTTGGENSFFGVEAGRDNVSGGGNSFFGAYAGRLNTASNNSFFGLQSGGQNTTGGENAFFGGASGSQNVSGSSNSFFGRLAGQKNVSGSFNSFFGNQAGRDNTGGSNSFFGASAGLINTSGADNSFFGVNAGVANVTGSGNSYFGRRAGRDSTGSNNTAVGIDAGRDNLTGSNNTFIGANADASGTNLTFATAIGAGAIVDFFDTVVIGRPKDRVKMPGTVEVGGSLHVTGDGFFDTVGLTLMPTPNGGPDVCLHGTLDRLANCASSIRYKSNVSTLTNGLETVLKLRPVAFDWKGTQETEVGFIAEEVDSIDSRLAYRKDGVVEGIRRNGITASIVGAVQAQNLVISSQKEKLLNLENQIQQLMEELERQRKALDSLRSEICLANPSRSGRGQK